MYEYEYRPLLFILIGEVSVLCLFFFVFFLKRIFFFFQIKNSKKREENISALIVKSLENEGYVDLFIASKVLLDPMSLLKGLESFDRLFKEESWLRLKKVLAEHFLFPKARRLAKSCFWKKRSFAARCFSLAPCKQNELILISLMKDRHFLIQSHAALALIALESPLGIKEVVSSMNDHPGFVRLFFRDALQGGSKEVINILIDLASVQSFHCACLEVFSRQSFSVPFPFLEKDLASENLEVRILAIKILSHNPIKNTESILIACSKDLEVKIRHQAVLGLSNFVSPQGVKRLEEIVLNSFECRKIRLEAAKALKKLGRVDILEKQNEKDLEAFKIAAYVLQFGSS